MSMSETAARQAEAVVLVVEDEFLIAMELKVILNDAGYAVLGPVATVSGALQLLADHHPDAAILDVNLEDGRSSAAAQQLVERRIPYLVASAYHASDFADEPLLTAAVNVGKPTLAAPLLSELRRMLAAADEQSYSLRRVPLGNSSLGLPWGTAPAITSGGTTKQQCRRDSALAANVNLRRGRESLLLVGERDHGEDVDVAERDRCGACAASPGIGDAGGQ
ncbi:response regulator [Bradyrhizobium sp. STM 3809]|uniref:response regulator n=1 Tax=Bradyrhizobium sp. STM 3809 TaxID=551936 RepID=UPI000240A7A3|nr:response regulator [Bradyrhizobium sp. STM 3809]CCD98627.1 conserved hypothetical protein [Bradyrhizobium sp. STM 3809]